MWRVIVCDGNKTEREQIVVFVKRCCLEKGLDVQIEGCANWSKLSRILKKITPNVMIVAQDGVEGLDIITSARILSGKILWFSDLDFGVQAYRLCIDYFTRKPVSYLKIERAFTRFLEQEPSQAEKETPKM